MTSDPYPPTGTTRAQKYALVAIFGLTLGLRFERINEISLSQYDEGVYVFNGLRAAFVDPLEFNFEQPLHAPPLFPWMIGALCWMIQAPWPSAGIVVSGLMGAATVPVVFLIARRLTQHLCFVRIGNQGRRRSLDNGL